VLEKVVTRMNFRDLSKATENFSQSTIIGLGLMGTMYKATLPNGWFVAEKRMHDFRHFEEHMVSELKTLDRLRHNNLLPLLGFCIESKERLLVYKYLSNGNLFDWLHSVEAQKKILEWPLTVKIAVGVARGLAWLHHGYNARVVHLNINSRSILLDRNFEPKLSNFGEAMLRISTKSSRVNSDFWEMAFVKEDVHGYGVRESE
jgi:serine/threonine protein kinase